MRVVDLFGPRERKIASTNREIMDCGFSDCFGSSFEMEFVLHSVRMCKMYNCFHR